MDGGKQDRDGRSDNDKAICSPFHPFDSVARRAASFCQCWWATLSFKFPHPLELRRLLCVTSVLWSYGWTRGLLLRRMQKKGRRVVQYCIQRLAVLRRGLTPLAVPGHLVALWSTAVPMACIDMQMDVCRWRSSCKRTESRHSSCTCPAKSL